MFLLLVTIIQLMAVAVLAWNLRGLYQNYLEAIEDLDAALDEINELNRRINENA